ncbi:MAG TPA: hypothetical protein VFN22_05000 [Gemmatimonadales bacterium]|nr:hypothetical protein [Gemmatimonadales bacterium]
MRAALVLLCLGLVGYVASSSLTGWFIERSVPRLLEASRKVAPDGNGELLWEKTAGKGIVPRWVSVLGLVAIPVFLGGLVLLLVAALF